MKLSDLFGRRKKQQKLLLARYDAAQTTSNNQRYWANADSLSANQANNPQVRRVLRNRSRYEAANNSYLKGIILTICNDTVGTGPKLQVLGDREIASQVEKQWERFANQIGLSAKLRTMIHARIVDGEAFGILITNPKHTPTIDLKLVEAEQVTAKVSENIFNPNNIDGVIIDDAGNPEKYTILKYHPGDSFFSMQHETIPAEQVIHLFRADRPGQYRGIPETTPALPLFALLRDYTLATLDAAKAAAYFAGIIYTDAPPQGTADLEPLDPVQLERNSLLTLPGGWKLDQVEAQQPSSTYKDFKNEILNELARCLNVPYNLAAGNSANFNFASARVDTQSYQRQLRVDQAELARVCLDRIFAAFLEEAILLGLLPEGAQNLSHRWIFEGRPHIDPVSETQSIVLKLQNNLTTLSDEYAKIGQDWEDALDQLAIEKQRLQELKLTQQEVIKDVQPPQT